ncbi:MAG: hypothetical protein GX558_07810 [Clostridiales bacterium]|nr:hypothetical protein [Clostridiales bacterium]
MRSYVIKRIHGFSGVRLSGELEPGHLPPPFDALPRAAIDCYPWDDCGYCPPAFAVAGWDEQGIRLLLAADEPAIRAEVDRVGGPVCQDSCLEFFLRPSPGSAAYLNVEATPRAVLHVGVGEGRHGRQVLTSLPDGFSPSHSVHRGRWWAVMYTVPAGFLRDRFGVALKSGLRMAGNFYKCGDLTAQPHWGMWQPYDLPQADFHRPELFGAIALG